MIEVKGTQTLPATIAIRERELVEAVIRHIYKHHKMPYECYLSLDNNIMIEEDSRCPDVLVRKATEEDIAALELIKQLWRYA